MSLAHLSPPLPLENNSSSIKEVASSKLEDIYLMGVDVWGKDSSLEDYLSGCRNSEKYRKGRWYALWDGDQALSSAITYQVSPINNRITLGIGSVATHKRHRQKGYATNLLGGIAEGYINNYNTEILFLFAEGGLKLYEREGFVALPNRLQRYDETILMVKSRDFIYPEIVDFLEKSPLDYF